MRLMACVQVSFGSSEISMTEAFLICNVAEERSHSRNLQGSPESTRAPPGSKVELEPEHVLQPTVETASPRTPVEVPSPVLEPQAPEPLIGEHRELDVVVSPVGNRRRLVLPPIQTSNSHVDKELERAQAKRFTHTVEIQEEVLLKLAKLEQTVTQRRLTLDALESERAQRCRAEKEAALLRTENNLLQQRLATLQASSSMSPTVSPTQTQPLAESRAKVRFDDSSAEGEGSNSPATGTESGGKDGATESDKSDEKT